MSENTFDFTAFFAEIPVRASVLFASTQQFCAPYIADEAEPMASVALCRDDIEESRQASMRLAEYEGRAFVDSSDAFFERLALHKAVSDVLPAFGRALIHCSSIEMDGEAVLFTAPSGTGKSTHSRLWKTVFGDAVSYVNDDKPFIGIKDGRVQVFGSPWQGKHNLGQPVTVPVRGLGIIVRDERNFSVRVDTIDAISILLKQMHRPKDKAAFTQTVEIIKAIVETVPVYEIHCNMSKEAAMVSHETFFG